MTPEIKWRIEQIRRGEVPEGYQRAGAKIIPYNWGIRQIGEVCVVNPARPQMIPDIVSFLAMADVSEDAKIVRQKQIRCSEANNGFSCFCRGDILIAKITPCFENGKGAYTATLETSVGFGSTEFHVLRCRIDPEFIFFHTVSFEFRKRLEAEMTGTAGQKRVQAESIAKYRIAVPPIIEQQKIAAILTTQDKVIELKEKRLAEKQRQKKYLMQQLLTGKKRLPGLSKSWQTVELGEIFNYIQPTAYLVKTTDYDDSYKTPVLTAGKTFILGYTNELEGIFTEVPVVIFDDFTTATKYVDFPFKVKSSAMKILTIKDGFNIVFAYEAMQLIKFTVGGHERHWISKYNCLTIDIPDIEEQTAIAEVLTAADREMELLRQEIEQEKQKKKALMQLLLTGIVRVNDDK